MATMYHPTSNELITINNCGSILFSTLLERLKKNDTTLTMLDLTNNDLSGGKFNKLIDALKANTSVKSLILVGCKLEDSCVSTLMDVFYRDESLTFLDVTSNNISYASCNMLLAVAQNPGNPYEGTSFKTAKLSVKTDFGDLDSSKNSSQLTMKDAAVKIDHTIPKPTIDQSKQKNIEEANAKKRDIDNAKSKISETTTSTNNSLTQAYFKEQNASNKIGVPSLPLQSDQSKIDELTALVKSLMKSYQEQQAELLAQRKAISALDGKVQYLTQENEGLRKEIGIMKDGSKLSLSMEREAIRKNPHLEDYYNFFKTSFESSYLAAGLISQNIIVSNDRSVCSTGAQVAAKVTAGIPLATTATTICAAGVDCGEDLSNRKDATGLKEKVGYFSDDRLEELAIEMTMARKEEIEKCSNSSNFTDAIKDSFAKAKGAPDITPIKRLVEADIKKIFEITRNKDSKIKPNSPVKELVALFINTTKVF